MIRSLRRRDLHQIESKINLNLNKTRSTRSNNHQLQLRRPYSSDLNSTNPSEPIKKKKGLFRSILLPTTLVTGSVYGLGIYGSFQNDQIRDFFMDQVPFGERLLNLCEDSNLEHLADLSKPPIRFLQSSFNQIKSIIGIDKNQSVDPPSQQYLENNLKSKSVEKIKAKTQAAVENTNQLSQSTPAPTFTNPPNPIPSTPQALNPPTDSSSISSAKSDPLSDLPTYNREIPIGHEPPPGYRGSPPRVRNPSTDPLPPPPNLPLVAPTVKDLSSSEPILTQLASSIDNLAGFLRDHPQVIVRAKDPSGQDASRVVLSATQDLKNLSDRLEAIKTEKQAQLQSQLEAQAKQYGKVLLDAERELHERLDQQEGNWKKTFDEERLKLAKSFEDKLASELETQQALINERLEQEVLSQGLEMQRRWMREIKSQVELEREGRWAKLAELEGCMKHLGRVTLDNEEYLEDNLRLNQLWNAIRAISSAAFESQGDKVPLDHQARALQRINNRTSKLLGSTIDGGEQEADQESSGSNRITPDVISAALESIPHSAIDSGVESLPSLTIWFKESVYPKIQSASLLPSQGGLISYMSSYILSHLFFTSSLASSSTSNDRSNQDPISILNRVNGFLDSKDLESAARELNSLSGWPKVLARDWLQAARSHLELQQAIQVIESEATLQSLLL